MTLDEAINILKSDIEYNKSIGCDTSYEEQIAEWLEELVMLRLDSCMIHMPERLHLVEDGYNKGIDDLMEKVSECFISDADWHYLVQEAKQLKAGIAND